MGFLDVLAGTNPVIKGIFSLCAIGAMYGLWYCRDDIGFYVRSLQDNFNTNVLRQTGNEEIPREYKSIEIDVTTLGGDPVNTIQIEVYKDLTVRDLRLNDSMQPPRGKLYDFVLDTKKLDKDDDILYNYESGSTHINVKAICKRDPRCLERPLEEVPCCVDCREKMVKMQPEHLRQGQSIHVIVKEEEKNMICSNKCGGTACGNNFCAPNETHFHCQKCDKYVCEECGVHKLAIQNGENQRGVISNRPKCTKGCDMFLAFGARLPVEPGILSPFTLRCDQCYKNIVSDQSEVNKELYWTCGNRECNCDYDLCEECGNANC